MEKTPLQKHVEFFDLDKDGVIYPWETFQGFRKLGFNLLIALLGTLGIHLTLSYPTLDSWWPEIYFPIYVKNIHKGKHGSDSQTYARDGNINHEKTKDLENIFIRFANGSDSIQSVKDVWGLSSSFMDAYDPFGWIASKAEWLLLWAANGYKLELDDIKAAFDGSFFDRAAEKYAKNATFTEKSE